MISRGSEHGVSQLVSRQVCVHDAHLMVDCFVETTSHLQYEYRAISIELYCWSSTVVCGTGRSIVEYVVRQEMPN